MSKLLNRVAEIAKLMVVRSQKCSDRKLDYSRSSIVTIDNMLDEASNVINDLDKEQIEELIETFGCYLLEVAYREFGGRFAYYQNTNLPVIIVGEPEYRIAMVTFDKVRGRLLGDKADDLVFFYDGFASAIKQAKVGINILFV